MAVNYAQYGAPANPYGQADPLNYQTAVSVPATTAPGAVNTAMGLQHNVYNQLPGYNASIGNVGANIQSETAGQLPADVIEQIQQAAAERGIATGTGGSQNNNASYLDALGLSSLNLTNMGQQNLTGILPTLPGSAISANPGFYATPGQYLQANEATVANQAGLATQNAGLAQAQKGLAMGAAAGGGAPGSFSIPGGQDDSTSWWNSPDFGAASYTYNSGSNETNVGGQFVDPTAQIAEEYGNNLYGAGNSAWGGLAEGSDQGSGEGWTGNPYSFIGSVQQQGMSADESGGG